MTSDTFIAYGRGGLEPSRWTPIYINGLGHIIQPKRHDPELLATLLAYVTSGSQQAAAEYLGVGDSTVCERLDRLEAKHGRVLVRNGKIRVPQLNERGRALLNGWDDVARRVMDERATTSADDHEGGHGS